MKFLGGFLKFIAILLILIGTVACTVLVVLGIMDDIIEPILVGIGVFIGVLFVALGVLGTGMSLSQIVKLKQRVAQLEQQARHAPTMTSAVPEVPAVPAESIPAQFTEPAPEDAPVKTSSNRWLPVILSGILVVIAIVIVIVFGGNKEKNAPIAETPIPQQVISPIETEDTTEEPAEVNAVELTMGSFLSTDFVEMTFEDIVIEADIKKSVTIDNVTRITGPEPLPGQVYICLSGNIKNTSHSELPVYDFFAGRFQIGDYRYEVSANDCDVLSADGSTESMIAPLMDYEYRIYVAIPEELAEFAASGEPVSFTFGFYENFANEELAYNRSFSDDPIATCPYQYFIPIQ